MTVNKRKKKVRYRGDTTHGCGSMKKRRGAGNRGGRGNSGSGKRGDQKKPSYWKDRQGKFGFTGRSVKHDVMNIADLEDRRATLASKGYAKEESGKWTIDLSRINVSKLLAAGMPSCAWDITVTTASQSAKEKIEKAGGSVKVKVAPGEE